MGIKTHEASDLLMVAEMIASMGRDTYRENIAGMSRCSDSLIILAKLITQPYNDSIGKKEEPENQMPF